MYYSNLVLGLTAMINLVLGLVIYARNRRNIINIFFAITTFGIFLWSLCIIFFNVGDLNTIYFWGQFTYFAVNFTIIFFLYFTFIFPRGNFPKNLFIRSILYILPLIILAISLIPKSIISEAANVNSQLVVKLGWGYYVHSAITILLFIWAYTNLIVKIRRFSGIQKMQILNLFIGTLISTVIAIITNVVLFSYTTQYNWLGPAGTLFMVSFMAYAITRYRLMDIRAIIFRTIAFGFVLLLITSVFSVISTLITKIFTDLAGLTSNIYSGLIIALLVTLFYQPTRRVVERATNTFLYKKSYDPDALLSSINDTTASILNLEQLLNKISKILTEAFHCEKIGVALLNGKKNKLQVSYKDGFKPGVAEALVDFPSIVKIMFRQFKETPGIFVIDERKTQFDNGEFKPVSPKLLLALFENDLALIVPLFAKDKLIGVLVIGTKKSGDPYASRDINVLNIISGQFAIAIENAQLYGHLEELVTERTEELGQANTKLESANVQLKKLDQSKSEFISIASHQLRTPLTAIKGWISMINDGDLGKLPLKIQHPMEVVYASNERLIRLVNDLLNISRIESGRQKYDFKKNDLVALADEVVTKLQIQAELKKLKLVFHKPKEKFPMVFCDAERIHEVMMNLVENSIKYTPAGSINVLLEQKPAGTVTFTVKDTGMGIAKEVMPLLFKKFSRGEGSFVVHTEGTGLGLYVAKLNVETHGGRVWVESEGAGKGSTFIFTIPIAGPKELPFEAPDAKK